MKYTNEIRRSDYLHVKEMGYANHKEILENMNMLANALAENETYDFKDIYIEYTFNGTECLATFWYESIVNRIICRCTINIDDKNILISHEINLDDNCIDEGILDKKSIDINHRYPRSNWYNSILRNRVYHNTARIDKNIYTLYGISEPILLELKETLNEVIIGVDEVLLKCFSRKFHMPYRSIIYPSYRRVESEQDKNEDKYLINFYMSKALRFSFLNKDSIVGDVGPFPDNNNIAMRDVNIKDIILRINNNTINMLIATGKMDYILSDVILQLKDNKIIISHKYKPHYFAVNGVYEDKAQTSKVIAHLTDDEVIPINEWEDDYSGSIVIHMTEYDHERRKLVESIIS